MISSADELGERLRDLEQENARLRDELKRLHAGVRCTGMTLGPGLVPSLPTRTSGTVMGLDELIMQVNADLTIGYINSPMARLLDIADRRRVMGEPLADWDQGSLGKGILRSVIDSALVTGSTVVVERVCPGIDLDKLPATGSRPVCDPVLRFVANEVKGRVELVVQDITMLRWLESTFARYVAPEVIEQMLMRPEENFMQMERRVVTVLFADLRGFTRITQQLAPRVLQEMINEFLTNMVASIGKFGGMVDKFVGDEVMAIFGAPVTMEDHALRGLLAALDMIAVHARTMGAWQKADRPAAGVGIGVTSGEVFIGNLGTDTRMDYTAIGHSVNLAARLCSAAGAGEILTVGECYQAAAKAMKTTSMENLPRFKFSPRGKQTFKNMDEEVAVLSLSVV
ncbi:MAG TPA: adenylate/guanylate cyclase domain-containing protein [Myxococcota bacterium]|nr:adenylate/guanylate cyclase domain-containing protein [Myxococcota bacterium]